MGNKVRLSKTLTLEAIKNAGLTPADVAMRLGVNRDYVGNLFAPSIGGSCVELRANAIAFICGVELESILEKDAPEESNDVEEVTIDTIHDDLKEIVCAIKEFTEVYKELWGQK